jgi:hypothetical protein
MGQLVLSLPADLSPEYLKAIAGCWLVGSFDGTPIPVERIQSPQQLTLERTENESVRLCVLWPLTRGKRVVSTATLRLRSEPYSALTELARGALNRVRQFVGTLTAANFLFPPSLLHHLQKLNRSFGRMIADDNMTTSEKIEVIDEAALMGDDCAALLTQYRFQARKERGLNSTMLGCRVSRLIEPSVQSEYLNTFNSVRIVPDWATLEAVESKFQWDELDALVNWAVQNKLKISFGPLVDLTGGRLPAWLSEWHGDLPNLAACLSEHVGRLISKYKAHVTHWCVFSGFNQADALELDEDDRIRLAARLLEVSLHAAPSSERSFALAQPWGEYLTNDELTYSPIVFADTLFRAGYTVQAIELELLSTGPTNPQNIAHDALDTIHLLEMFEQLGVTLEVSLDHGPNQLLATVLATPSVRAAYWDTWKADHHGVRNPAAALVSESNSTTPLVPILAHLRTEWLS